MAKETAQTSKTKIETLKSAAQEQGGAAVEEIKTVRSPQPERLRRPGATSFRSRKKILLRR
jgi:hypothetical protein